LKSAYDNALAELYALANRGIEPGLGRMKNALALLGHPERELRVVHVAGTNGKGSVAAMIAHGLATGEKRVGLYTSPHLSSLTERMRIFGAPAIEPAEIVEAWERVRDLDVPVTFFEAVTLIAFALFQKREIDVAVLEVGLGGRLDATNVIDRPLACAITRIGIDHTEWLGADLASIAAEKAGILRRGVPAVVAPQPDTAREAIEREARRIGAPIRIVGRDIEVEASETISVREANHRVENARPLLLGAHQHENIGVAVGVLFSLEDIGLSIDPRAAVETVAWPGRLERIESGATSFLLDAAHNVDGASALAAFLASSRKRRILLFGAMSDKDWRSMIALLAPHVEAIVCAAPALSRAVAPETIARASGGVAAASPHEAIAIARALASPDGEVVVAGSIYLMAEVRAELLGLPREPPIAL
jgi:dihydrofolate synthase/folylpolyglutamate synthase